MAVGFEKWCAECGREFVAGAPNTRYCSDECRSAANKRNEARAKKRAKERMERDERCIAFLQRRAKNVPCCECRCRVIEGEWIGSEDWSGGSTANVHMRIWCDKGLEPMVGCPGYECGHPQRRVREYRRAHDGRGKSKLVEVNRLRSLMEIDD